MRPAAGGPKFATPPHRRAAAGVSVLAPAGGRAAGGGVSVSNVRVPPREGVRPGSRSAHPAPSLPHMRSYPRRIRARPRLGRERAWLGPPRGGVWARGERGETPTVLSAGVGAANQSPPPAPPTVSLASGGGSSTIGSHGDA